MKMLIVEDEPTMLEFLERLFLGRAIDVRAVPSGSAAAETLESWAPHLLISDLDLSGVTGEELARAAALLPRPPRVILMSGNAERLERARPLASTVLLKPFRVVELMTAVGPLSDDR